MILCTYAVRDVASNVFRMNFMRPERVDGRGEVFHAEAIRYFSDGVKAEKTELSVHPGDFELFLLGSFDDLTGRYVNLDVPERISRGTDHIES